MPRASGSSPVPYHDAGVSEVRCFVLRGPVLDKTELGGAFDYTQPIPDSQPDYRDNSDSFLRLLSDLGLKMERSKGAGEYFVIDRAERAVAN